MEEKLDTCLINKVSCKKSRAEKSALAAFAACNLGPPSHCGYIWSVPPSTESKETHHIVHLKVRELELFGKEFQIDTLHRTYLSSRSWQWVTCKRNRGKKCREHTVLQLTAGETAWEKGETRCLSAVGIVGTEFRQLSNAYMCLGSTITKLLSPSAGVMSCHTHLYLPGGGRKNYLKDHDLTGYKFISLEEKVLQNSCVNSPKSGIRFGSVKWKTRFRVSEQHILIMTTPGFVLEPSRWVTITFNIRAKCKCKKNISTQNNIESCKVPYLERKSRKLKDYKILCETEDQLLCERKKKL